MPNKKSKLDTHEPVFKINLKSKNEYRILTYILPFLLLLSVGIYEKVYKHKVHSVKIVNLKHETTGISPKESPSNTIKVYSILLSCVSIWYTVLFSWLITKWTNLNKINDEFFEIKSNISNDMESLNSIIDRGRSDIHYLISKKVSIGPNFKSPLVDEVLKTREEYRHTVAALRDRRNDLRTLVEKYHRKNFYNMLNGLPFVYLFDVDEFRVEIWNTLLHTEFFLACLYNTSFFVGAITEYEKTSNYTFSSTEVPSKVKFYSFDLNLYQRRNFSFQLYQNNPDLVGQACRIRMAEAINSYGQYRGEKVPRNLAKLHKFKDNSLFQDERNEIEIGFNQFTKNTYRSINLPQFYRIERIYESVKKKGIKVQDFYEDNKNFSLEYFPCDEDRTYGYLWMPNSLYSAIVGIKHSEEETEGVRESDLKVTVKDSLLSIEESILNQQYSRAILSIKKLLNDDVVSGDKVKKDIAS